MNDVLSSQTDRASSIRVQDLALYLRKTGWHRTPHPNERLLVFQFGNGDHDGQPLKIVLASSDEYTDSTELIENALDLLSALDGLDRQQVINAVHALDRDILTVRFVGPQTSTAGLPLETATRFVLQLRDMLAYAACVEENPRPYFPKATSIGRKYAESCFFGHTFPGSFGFTIESPTGPAPVAGQTDSPPPFERRVMARVFRGIRDLREAILSGQPELLVNRYETGLNANLCELLEETLKHSDNTEMEYAIAWSPEWPVTNELKRLPPLRIERRAASFLAAAARQLRSMEESANRAIRGKVVALQSDATGNDEEWADDQEQTATILWEESKGKRFRVRVALDPDHYRQACDAHKLGQTVQVTGRLEKVGKFWRLMAPTNFEIAN